MKILGIALDMLRTFAANLREGIVGESSAELCGPEVLQLMARERYQAKVRDALAEFVATLNLGPSQKAALRYEVRQVLCGVHGTLCSSFDVCPHCGGKDGSAVPVPHPPTLERLRLARVQAERNYRRAVNRRRPSVFRLVPPASGASPTASAKRKDGAMRNE